MIDPDQIKPGFRLLTITKAAKMLDIHPNTFRKLQSKGLLPQASHDGFISEIRLQMYCAMDMNSKGNNVDRLADEVLEKLKLFSMDS